MNKQHEQTTYATLSSLGQKVKEGNADCDYFPFSVVYLFWKHFLNPFAAIET